MTVIVYRDGIMAADSQITDDYILRGQCKKIYRAPCGALGAATGLFAAGTRFGEWFVGGRNGNFDPKSGDRYFGALIVEADGTLWAMDNTGTCSQFSAPWAAEGGGDQIAMGALEMGATAEQAVSVAIKHHAGCGGRIQVERLDLAP